METSQFDSFGFKAGSFPFKYLGLPLMCKRLKYSDYAPLIDKVATRFNQWSNKTLSFAGRLQLISSVIYGTVNFWFSAFMLPKACIKTIEKLCCKFLWSGSTDKRHSAKISWKTCCLPKEEGGLGLRDFGLWNKILGLRLIWLLFTNSGSLWVAWIHEHRLKNCSLWASELKAKDSWIWKSILVLRPLIRHSLRSEIGNGRKTSFWFDNWVSIGPLISFMGQNGPNQLGVPLSASVFEATNSNSWNLRPARTDIAATVHTLLIEIQVPQTDDDNDNYYLTFDGKTYNSFSASKFWDLHRTKDTTKRWTSTIWFKGNSPNQAFHMWVANCDRLPTRNRLRTWGMNVPTNCCLCDENEETREHLFLRCTYSDKVWEIVHRRLGLSHVGYHTWVALMEWSSASSTNVPVLLKRLLSQAVIYLLWRERNTRLHDNQSIPPELLFRKVDRLIRDSILARRSIRGFISLMQTWLRYS